MRAEVNHRLSLRTYLTTSLTSTIAAKAGGLFFIAFTMGLYSDVRPPPKVGNLNDTNVTISSTDFFKMSPQ